jgi:GNAT superfamily N-acetyltransferase
VNEFAVYRPEQARRTPNQRISVRPMSPRERIVDPRWRRQGIGELRTVDRMAWTAERADAVWYFANIANGATLDLHRRFGFVEVTRDFTFPNAPLAPGTGVLLRAPLPVVG